MRAILTKVDIDPVDAAVVADVLVESDLRGIESHGVARLESYYVSRLRKGPNRSASQRSKPSARPATSILIDAGNGLGHPVAKRTMEKDHCEGARARLSVRRRPQFEPLRDRRILRDDGVWRKRSRRHGIDQYRALWCADLRSRHDVGNESVRLCDPDLDKRAGVRARLRDHDGAARQTRSLQSQRTSRSIRAGRSTNGRP